MKKIASTSVAVLASLSLFTGSALAATSASFAPANINTAPGKTFTVVVTVNPQGVANYAEKIEIKYPADLLEVTAFVFGNSWMALSESGYDMVDNVNGVAVKTAGYPGGITSATMFGTFTFKTKKAGNGAIKIGNNSLAFEANSQTVITGSDATFAIVAPIPEPKKEPVVTPKPVEVKKVEVVAPAPVVEPKEEVVPVVEIMQEYVPSQSEQATVETNADFKTGGNMVAGVVAAGVVLMIGGVAVYAIARKKEV